MGRLLSGWSMSLTSSTGQDKSSDVHRHRRALLAPWLCSRASPNARICAAKRSGSGASLRGPDARAGSDSGFRARVADGHSRALVQGVSEADGARGAMLRPRGQSIVLRCVRRTLLTPGKRILTVFSKNNLGPGGLAVHKDGRIFITALGDLKGAGSIIAVKPDGWVWDADDRSAGARLPPERFGVRRRRRFLLHRFPRHLHGP